MTSQPAGGMCAAYCSTLPFASMLEFKRDGQPSSCAALSSSGASNPKTSHKQHAAQAGQQRSIAMAKVISQLTVNLPRLMEAGEYGKLCHAFGKPSLQQLK
ncbi:hypothetical protein [Azotobacter armeniacus]